MVLWKCFTFLYKKFDCEKIHAVYYKSRIECSFGKFQFLMLRRSPKWWKHCKNIWESVLNFSKFYPLDVSYFHNIQNVSYINCCTFSSNNKIILPLGNRRDSGSLNHATLNIRCKRAPFSVTWSRQMSSLVSRGHRSVRACTGTRMRDTRVADGQLDLADLGADRAFYL